MKTFFLTAQFTLLIFSNLIAQNTLNMHTNELIHETSPYLLQHAHNPVNWNAWNPEILEKAKKENKLILISVGYAACHWCHVMEHESFEDEEVAKIMNEHFINIKVDREERPDIDQIYMSAVQIITGNGGWPMNVVALPDGRPFWGGTYFKKDNWMHTLKQIAKMYEKNPEKIIEYANNLEQGIKTINLVKPNLAEDEFSNNEIEASVNNWSEYFDYKFGGNNSAPKFMMPVSLNFLLRHSNTSKDKKLTEYIHNTLTKIAYGGVYDHVGGGFSRYSVDEKWHVPHFEKMLYDNAQLVSVYSNAFSITKNPLYKKAVEETLVFVERELMTKDCVFYSSLDADSLDENNELEEGAFYVWKKEELKTLLKTGFEIFSDYYNVNNFGYWEHDNYVLIRNKTDDEISKKHSILINDLHKTLYKSKSILFKERSKRKRPRLDDKSLTSWNALMLKGYVDAYKALGNKQHLDVALKNAAFILKNQFKNDGGLFHNYKEGKSTINGFLEDYSTVIDAFLSLHEVTLDEKWLNISRDLTNYCFDHFYDTNSNMFFFTSNSDQVIVTRTIEKNDNVIPASNSIMAHNLFKLSHYFGDDKYLKTSKKMLNNMRPNLEDYGYNHGNWLDLMLNFTSPFYEIAVVGKNAEEKIKELNNHYLPNCIITASKKESNLPLFKNRYVEDETLIYVCINNSCKLPVKDVSKALKLINY